MVTLEKKQLSDGTWEVTVAGKIDEKFDGSAIVEQARGAKVVLELSGVRAISSLGVRAFETFVASLALGEVVLTNVSPALAAQMAMIPNLCHGATVASAYLPFACAQCGAESSHAVPWLPNAHLHHAPRCRCGATMELDGLPEHYLPFAA